MLSVVPPVRLLVLEAVWPMPQTFGPLVAQFGAVDGLTVVSEDPCQMATRGQGPVYPG